MKAAGFDQALWGNPSVVLGDRSDLPLKRTRIRGVSLLHGFRALFQITSRTLGRSIQRVGTSRGNRWLFVQVHVSEGRSPPRKVRKKEKLVVTDWRQQE